MADINIRAGGLGGENERVVSNVVRLCRVSEVDYGRGIVSTEWMDQAGEPGPNIPIPHPFAGRAGEGIYVGIRPGTVVAIAMASHERYVLGTTVPLPGMYSDDIASTDEAQFDDTGFPSFESGDVVLQGVEEAQFRLTGDGDVILDNGFGEGFRISGDSDDSTRATVFEPTPVEYTISQAGISAEGLIRRDVRVEDGENDFADFLSDLDSEVVLEEVGWDPSRDVVYFSRDASATGTNTGESKRVRNPGFVEKRETVLEYGRSWDVEDYKEELDRLETEKAKPFMDLKERRQRRSNVLSLSLTHPNELMEKVSGTLVDVFGNILDINKNKIPIPKGNTPRELLESVMENTRRSVAYHMEINTRKGWRYNDETKLKPELLRSAPKVKDLSNNARDRSRWSMRVDKEGLTTINIPATSETGNIPLLTRQETSSVLDIDSKGKIKSEKGRFRDDTRLLFRNDENKDIFHEQVGPGGIEISAPASRQVKNRFNGKRGNWQESSSGGSKEQVQFGEFIKAGTAFHNIVNTAKTLLENDVNKTAASLIADSPPTPEAGPTVMTKEVDPKVPTRNSTAMRNLTTGLIDGQPNAGGRSAQLSLDGSLEMSVGANTIDRVSWIIDTAGAVISRLGRDRFGRSAVIHADGTIALEVGGFDYIGESSTDKVDTRFVGRGAARKTALPKDKTQFRAGKIVIKVRRANPTGIGPDTDGDDTLLVIDETGMTIQTAGRLNFISDLDMTFKSPRILLNGEVVQFFEDNPRFLNRSGRVIV